MTANQTKPAPQLLLQAIIHDLEADSYELELRFQDVKGGVGSLRIERALIREPSRVVGRLLDAGAILPPNRKAASELVDLALNAEPVEQYAITRRGGWHGSKYVMRTETFGDSSRSLRYAGPTTTYPSYGLRQGSAAAWADGLDGPMAASSYLTFAMGVACGAPLLAILGEDEGATFHFYGFSSTGKSLASRVCESMTGRARNADLATFDMTDRSIEELCHSRNDASAIFDEEGRNTGSLTRKRDRRAKLAFMIPGGRGTVRSRSAVRNADLANLTWRLFALSSGEEPLENATERRRAGEQVRHIDVPVPPPEEGGIFDRLDDGPEEGIRLAAQVERTIEQNYGEAIRPYLAVLTERRSELTPKVRELVNEFITSVGADANPWERRFAQKFAIVAAGGTFAAEFGIAPFDADHARRCVTRIYRRARAAIRSVEETYNRVLAGLRRALADESLLPRVEKGDALPRKLRDSAWGFRRIINGREIIGVDPSRFEAIAGSAPLADAVLDLMIERRVAIMGVGGKRRPQIAVQGFPRDGRSRWVCLRAAAL
jgi:hypothetical protein